MNLPDQYPPVHLNRPGVKYDLGEIKTLAESESHLRDLFKKRHALNRKNGKWHEPLEIALYKGLKAVEEKRIRTERYLIDVGGLLLIGGML